MMQEISIIIPALNEEAYLPLLLESIATQNFDGRVQVIVVDGGSEDETVKKAKAFTHRIKDLTITHSPKGTSKARNIGARLAKYEILLFIDADIILPPQFLSQFVKKLDPSQPFVDFILHLPIKPNVADYIWVIVVFSYLSVSRLWDPICSGSFLPTTKQNHKKINGFNEDIVMGEDIDYARRSIAQGARYHLHYRPHVLASPRRLREQGRWRVLWYWTKGYLYMTFKGPITNNNLFPYPFGAHTKDSSEK